MESKDLKALSELYLQTVYEDKKYGYDKDGNSLNPVDIEKRKKEDDDLAGSPNKNGKKNGKKAKRWWDDDGDGKTLFPRVLTLLHAHSGAAVADYCTSTSETYGLKRQSNGRPIGRYHGIIFFPGRSRWGQKCQYLTSGCLK